MKVDLLDRHDIPRHDLQNVICSLHTTEHEALKLSRHCNLKQVDRIGFMMLLINNAGQSVMSHYTSYSFQQLSNYLLL
ncbi:hypothetical protein SUGI_0040480 [Cryptomeria japonica]|nr:hypothetical protein SUGI_0040480 [Cryptomeria japonica]